MALSNWDLLAFDKDGKNCNGILEIDINRIEIYKNFLYVKVDNNILVHIDDCNLIMNGFCISSIRGPQLSIFAYISYLKDELVRMAGIGCYGFENQEKKFSEKLGFDLSTKDYILESSDKIYTIIIYNGEKVVSEHDIERTPDLESKWIGIQKETYDKFIEWLKSIDKNNEKFVKWINSFEQPKRINQGDRFFSNYPGFEQKKITTEIGKVDTPIMIKILERQDNIYGNW